MPVEKILILTKSRKHGGRCIAGLSTADGRWVRPVGDGGEGELYPYHYAIDEKVPKVFDIVRFEYEEGKAPPGQPENLVVTDAPWEFVERVPVDRAYDWVKAALDTGPELLGSRLHYVDAEVAAEGLKASLALLEPNSLTFSLDHHSSKLQGSPRATFTHGGQHYDLPLTEFVVAPRLQAMGYGTHSVGDLDLPEAAHPLLAVSLGTAHNGRCYKLVAAFLPLP